MKRSRARWLAALSTATVLMRSTTRALETPPSLRAGALTATISIDGRVTEPAWDAAASIDNFRQTDPVEGAPPTARTRVQVLADAHALVIGIICDQPDRYGSRA